MIKRSHLFAIMVLILSINAAGCANKTKIPEASNTPNIESGEEVLPSEEMELEVSSQNGEQAVVQETAVENTDVSDVEILHFVDVFGTEYQAEINPNVEKHSYISDCFQFEGKKLSYVGDERYSSRFGIDVSHHQGYIDWKKVKSEGVEFAFLRIGYRGYGKEGKLREDTEFINNIKNAQAEGIDIGVYFFAQAVNEEEAREEAEFVLDMLEGYELQLPVVYDPESILDADARTDDVSGVQFTKNTIVFCEMIRNAGYEPMIYSNMLWEAYEFDLEKLSAYPIWYADYEPVPQTPYHFEFWQYSNTGSINGISGNVDLDIQLILQEGF